MIRTILGAFALVMLMFAAAPQAKAEWLCNDDRCVWVSWDVDEPAYALAWGPPVRPNCFWKQGFFGRWKMVCPLR